MIGTIRRYAAIAASALALERVQPKLCPRTADELAFLPAALEIVETPPSPLGRAIAGTIMLFLTIAVAWASLGELDIHATAQGQIIPRGKTKVVQPPEPGVIKEILVRDGDRVREGQVLVVLDRTGSGADVTRLTRDRDEARAAMARLRAQLAGSNRLADAEAIPPALQRIHQQQLEARLNEQRAVLDGLTREHEQKRAERDALRADQDGLEQTVPLLRQVQAMRAELARGGNGSKLQLLDAQQQLIDRTQSLASTRARLIQAEAAIAATDQRRRQAEEQIRADAYKELAEAERQAETTAAELDKAAQRDTQLQLRAPVDGVVQQLAVHAPGAVVSQAQAVLAVVPTAEGIDAEVMLANKDIGFVHDGQGVELKLETFPFTRYGTVPGTVLTVSHDAVQSPDPNRGNTGRAGQAGDPPASALYAVRIRLERETMVTDAGTVALTPGMAVTAEIKTGNRKVIEYVLAPLLRYRDESWRER